ncbi:MAG: hypothetical protein DM484_27690 [Candidatus Methylumidiphilus alinenensis]|uniref:Uncharacterized protein n=1 Tax=Candidatus Methylumidiphilus alinenensis TaxID=2202197 RepID=A0A2W4QEW6_9GAMM|nr:MAG: hypothetical protein DM484_27690 [Candidatus Methylumidiphilus alinenensis]
MPETVARRPYSGLHLDSFYWFPSSCLGTLAFSSSSLPWLGKQSFKGRVPKPELGNEHKPVRVVP